MGKCVSPFVLAKIFIYTFVWINYDSGWSIVSCNAKYKSIYYEDTDSSKQKVKTENLNQTTHWWFISWFSVVHFQPSIFARMTNKIYPITPTITRLVREFFLKLSNSRLLWGVGPIQLVLTFHPYSSPSEIYHESATIIRFCNWEFMAI